MFIQTEETPNINAIKFIPGNIPIAKDKPYDFPNKAASEGVSDLAKKLFEIEGVVRVFFGDRFMTITKSDQSDWVVLKPHIFATIVEYMTNGWAIFKHEDKKAQSDEPHLIDSDTLPEEEGVVKEIKALIDERVRPFVAEHGGDISFVKFNDGVVYLKLLGACSGCPSSSATLKGGVESMLKHFIPEIERVEEEFAD